MILESLIGVAETGGSYAPTLQTCARFLFRNLKIPTYLAILLIYLLKVLGPLMR